MKGIWYLIKNLDISEPTEEIRYIPDRQQSKQETEIKYHRNNYLNYGFENAIHK